MVTKEQAKKIPIQDLYRGELKKFGNILRGKCPFHDDSGTPNFTIYPETNSFYCFREGVGGDSIKFFMLLKDVDFKTALEEMG
jgi:DNA primase